MVAVGKVRVALGVAGLGLGQALDLCLVPVVVAVRAVAEEVDILDHVVTLVVVVDVAPLIVQAAPIFTGKV